MGGLLSTKRCLILMRQGFVAGNWKMNGSASDAKALVDGIIGGLNDAPVGEVAVCPPYVYLGSVGMQVNASLISLGAQDVSEHTAGAYTGEIAPSMLADIGCAYVIVGHSERRTLHGESSELVARKTQAVVDANMKPIVCVGETLEEREAGNTEAVVGQQLEAVFAHCGGEGALNDMVVAYEPVWAIGTGKTASPAQAQAVHAFLRAQVAAHDAQLAAALRILYGGSVKADNAAELFSQTDIDGGLIGGAALKADDFLSICRAAA